MIDKLNELCMWLSHQKGMMSKDYAKDLAKIIVELRQQADKVSKYEQVLQSIANDYHELSDHKIEVQVRNHKKWAREVLE